ncbi:MAG: hypothetical protein PHH08_03965, partial [Candidatus ainarchaeum sp.]|nr:hypothetical protein [Candidatus ainarchaeum sp.]
IRPVDSSQLLASLEKLVKMNELQKQAEQAISRTGFEIPVITGIALQEQKGAEMQSTVPAVPGQAEKQQAVQQPAEKKGLFGMFRRQAQKPVEKYTANVLVNQVTKEEAKQEHEEEQEQEFQKTREKEETEEEQYAPGEREQIREINRTVEAMQRPKKEVHINPLPITRFFRRPREEPKKVIIEQESGTAWSEAEIPTFPTTLENKQKEKLKTTEKEIQKFRIETDLDLTLQKIKEKGTMKMNGLLLATHIEKARLQELLNILEEQGLIRIEYPAFGDITIKSADYVRPSKAKAKKEDTNPTIARLERQSKKEPAKKPEKQQAQKNTVQARPSEKKKGFFGFEKQKK